MRPRQRHTSGSKSLSSSEGLLHMMGLSVSTKAEDGQVLIVNKTSSQICPSNHLHLIAICLMRPVCFLPSATHSPLKHLTAICPMRRVWFWPSATHSLLKQSVLDDKSFKVATDFLSPGWPLKTDLTVFQNHGSDDELYALCLHLSLVHTHITTWMQEMSAVSMFRFLNLWWKCMFRVSQLVERLFAAKLILFQFTKQLSSSEEEDRQRNFTDL
jgi:hypothetical protein